MVRYRKAEDSNLVKCIAVSLDGSFIAFRMIVLPSASRSGGPRFWLLGQLDPDDKDTTLPRNVRIYSPNDTASQLERLESSAMQLWETTFSRPRIIFVMKMSLQRISCVIITCIRMESHMWFTSAFVHSCESWRNPNGILNWMLSKLKLDATLHI